MTTPSEYNMDASGAQTPQSVLNEMSAGRPISAGTNEPSAKAKLSGVAKKAVVSLVALGLSATMLGNVFNQKDTQPIEVTQKTNVTQQMFAHQRGAFASAHKDEAIQASMVNMQAKIEKSHEAYQAARQKGELAAQQIAGLKGGDYLNPEKLEQTFGPAQEYINAKWEYLSNISVYENVLAETSAREFMVKANGQSDVSPEVMASVALAHSGVRATIKELKDNGEFANFEMRTLLDLDKQIDTMIEAAKSGDIEEMAYAAEGIAMEIAHVGENDPLHEAFNQRNVSVYENLSAKMQSETNANHQRDGMRG